MGADCAPPVDAGGGTYAQCSLPPNFSPSSGLRTRIFFSHPLHQGLLPPGLVTPRVPRRHVVPKPLLLPLPPHPDVAGPQGLQHLHVGQHGGVAAPQHREENVIPLLKILMA